MMDHLRAGPAKPGDDLGSGFELKGTGRGKKSAVDRFTSGKHPIGIIRGTNTRDREIAIYRMAPTKMERESDKTCLPRLLVLGYGKQAELYRTVEKGERARRYPTRTR